MAPIDSDRWSARIARARQLASSVPAAAELLTFAAALSERQRSLPGVGVVSSQPVTTLAASVDRDAIVAAIPALIGWLPSHAPQALSAAAVAMKQVPLAEWRRRLDAWIETDDDADPHARFVLEAATQPFAESAAASVAATQSRPASAAVCRFCGKDASLATLREAGHGARRSLQCGLCLTEWPAPRVGCVGCGETAFDRLPVFRADDLPAARVDACDTCRVYVKAIDFTKDGLAVAVVDDLATVALDLWAREQGYRRLRSHLLGV